MTPEPVASSSWMPADICPIGLSGAAALSSSSVSPSSANISSDLHLELANKMRLAVTSRSSATDSAMARSFTTTSIGVCKDGGDDGGVVELSGEVLLQGLRHLEATAALQIHHHLHILLLLLLLFL